MRGMPGFIASWKAAKMGRQSIFGVAAQINLHWLTSLPNDSAAFDLTEESPSLSSATIL